MIVEKYETGFVAVKKAVRMVEGMDKVIAYMSKTNDLVNCRDIGIAVFGEKEYTDSRRSRHYIGRLGSILKVLCETGFVERVKVDGKPLEYEDREWINEPSDGEDFYTTVMDAKGRTFEVKNPFYTGSYTYGNGHWETVKKTIIPKVNKYRWIG